MRIAVDSLTAIAGGSVKLVVEVGAKQERGVNSGAHLSLTGEDGGGRRRSQAPGRR